MLKESNARRFINAYNLVDTALRIQADLKRSMSYTEAIRRAAKSNSIVAKYEDQLIDYGRLRNAIVHNSMPDNAIADPYIEVVEEYEKIAKLIATPPLAVKTVAKSVVSTLEYDVKVKEVIEFGYKNGFSTLPIFKNGMLIGVCSGQKLIDVLGKKIYEKIDIESYIKTTTIEDALKEFANENYYTIVDEKITLDKIMNLFTENRKLQVVLITKTGTLLEKPVAIITISDIMDINKILDNFTVEQ